MQTTKIQINSLEALERLIGGDSQLEIELRSAVAAAFAEKHIKTLVRQIAEAGLTDSIKTLIDTQILQTIPDPNQPSYYNSKVKVLRPEVRNILAERLAAMVKELVDGLMQQARNDVYKQIEQGFEGIADYVKTSLEPRITDQIIYNKVKEKLASL
jgi:hypothetical protein